jgi:hypothetical protein
MQRDDAPAQRRQLLDDVPAEKPVPPVTKAVRAMAWSLLSMIAPSGVSLHTADHLLPGPERACP